MVLALIVVPGGRLTTATASILCPDRLSRRICRLVAAAVGLGRVPEEKQHQARAGLKYWQSQSLGPFRPTLSQVAHLAGHLSRAISRNRLSLGPSHWSLVPWLSREPFKKT